MGKYPIIRTIYLYLFALVGLSMTTIGAAQLINLGLKAFIFTQADTELIQPYYMAPRVPITETQSAQELVDNKEAYQLTDEQVQYLNAWIDGYNKWLEEESKDGVDYKTQQRHREASYALSLILVGLPLYLYHWKVIKKDIKEKKKEAKKA